MDDYNEQSFVKITNREIYDGLRDVQRDLASMVGRVDAVLTDNIKIKEEHGKRIRGLELKMYTLLSGCVTLAGLLIKVGGI